MTLPRTRPDMNTILNKAEAFMWRHPKKFRRPREQAKPLPRLKSYAQMNKERGNAKG